MMNLVNSEIYLLSFGVTFINLEGWQSQASSFVEWIVRIEGQILVRFDGITSEFNAFSGQVDPSSELVSLVGKRITGHSTEGSRIRLRFDNSKEIEFDRELCDFFEKPK